ncbi:MULTISPECIES: flavin reductase family protein [Alphaproteobacteria]|uniref:Flavin reductase n=2 Tax=Alphaproteobacteria TaxID=28211 RepID=A0A512HEA5_9HYPH|nr:MULTISPECIES: flavin reductase family protein [Alphaproteobacteria]GEO83680.1 flavin reductase [Ciceribacter naphthalenivorans]GLR24168.1 flavin reductase [Ciceribacter naphthalenivorans]GLT07024.1 flavin reductase [Sphingomonas psychrolutea]
MKAYALDKVYQLIEPGPVVLLTTAFHGKPNVMTMSWHMMMEFTPPRIGCIVSSADHSFAALSRTGECVISIPSAAMAEKVVAVGNCSGRDTDKFATIGLTALPAEAVSAPLIGECFANLECKVVDRDFVERHNLFVLDVVKAWHDPKQVAPKTLHHKGYGTFAVDGEDITLDSKMP